MSYALSFLSAMLIGFFVTHLCMRISNRFGWVERLRSDRWHRLPVARFGGVALWLAFITAALIFVPARSSTLWKLIGVSTLMFLVGFWDDVFGLTPRRKLLLQTLATSLVFAAGVTYPFRESVMVNLIVSSLWVIGLVNAFNLIDNMDGLSAGTALIATAYLFVLFWSRGATDILTLLCAFAGALVGFLVFNFHPARIFMGDAGSLSIGFLLASVTMLDVTHLSGFSALLLVPVLVFIVPILDTFFVSITRKVRGQPISQGGTDHTSHRLVRFGFGERGAVLVLYLLSAASGVIALLIRDLPLHHAIALTGFWLLVISLCGVNLFRESPDQLLQGESRGLRRILHPDSVSLLLDPVALSLAMYGAFLFRFAPDITAGDLSRFLLSAPVVVLCQFASLICFGVYRDSWWRGTRRGIYRILQAILLGTVVGVVILVGTDRFLGHSRLVFVADLILALIMLVGIRQAPFFARDVAGLFPRRTESGSVLVLGTYDGAEIVLRLLKEWKVTCVGLVDLNHGSDTGRRVWGFPVLGGLDDLASITRIHGVNEVVLSERQVSEEQMARITLACRDLAITLSSIARHPITPAGTEVPNGQEAGRQQALAAKAGSVMRQGH